MDDGAAPRRRRLVGQPIPRFEDLRFITGRGRYTDDIAVAGAAHAAFARSDQAQAVRTGAELRPRQEEGHGRG